MGLVLFLASKSWRRTMLEPDQIEDFRVAREVRRMVSCAAARTADTVAVVGPQALDYVLALCRSGFERAVCVSAQSPRACGEPIDHLFVTGPMTDDQLALVVSSIGRRVHADGVIVAALRDVDQDGIVCRALGELGLAAASPVLEGSGGLMAAHRLSKPERFAVAA